MPHSPVADAIDRVCLRQITALLAAGQSADAEEVAKIQHELASDIRAFELAPSGSLVAGIRDAVLKEIL